MKKLLVDYISDIHFNSYKFDITKYLIEEKQSNILIIAGDVGHNLEENIYNIKILKKFYKHILIVLGNHDYYFYKGEKFKGEKFLNSFDKVEKSKEAYNNIEGVHCFNGDIIEIEGIKFGGADSWYSNDYLINYFKKTSSIKKTLNLWNKSINDASYIFDQKNQNQINFFEKIYLKEFNKLLNIKDEVDVMISHVNPSILKEHQAIKYSESIITTFFNFDGRKIFENSNIKYWFFGHTHTKLNFIINKINFLCNPLGYPSESSNKYKFINTIELKI